MAAAVFGEEIAMGDIMDKGKKEESYSVQKEEEVYWYWFLNIPSVGIGSCRRLLQLFGGPEQIFQKEEKELSQVLSAGKCQSLMASRDLSRCQRELMSLNKKGVRFICWDSPDYPERLRHIYDPPLGLYLIGRLPDFTKPVLAVVGSRKATVYGLRQAFAISRDLACRGVQIISGLAAGIDSAGHRGALEGRGYTLGILGGGIDTMYPQENFNLYREMYEKGGVLSEYNAGIPNHRGLFPMRNRLISGLADGIFVVQAGRHSGSLITADLGLNQGKTIYALPGRVTDACSIGTNSLIAQGAVMVNRAEDILDDLNMMDQVYSPARPSTYTRTLKEEEYRVLDCLRADLPVSYEQLLDQCPVEERQLRHILIELELQGFLYQPDKNVFLKNR